MRRAELPWDDRQDAEKAQTVSALRALLAGIVDYAGLFPPAALDMSTAVHNYAAYRASDDGWMLGRFVVPVSRLDEFQTALSALGTEADPEWRLSALLGTDVDGDVRRAREFSRANEGRARIDSLEGKFSSAESILRAAEVAGSELDLFAELAVDSQLESLLGAVKNAGVCAKIRTGGVTQDAFPPAQDIVRFMRCCVASGVVFKATAGLHHPLRARYRLTYEVGSPIGSMHGFLNVFLAAGLMSNGLSEQEGVRLLEEEDPSAFSATPISIRWRDHVLDENEIRVLRDRVLVSFGSCSFAEPVNELRLLALMP